MHPHERSLVKRLQGKPFALIGVTNDAPMVIKDLVKRGDITWRNIREASGVGGLISPAWHVNALPRIYVIDAQGVIRYHGVRGEEMDRAVDLLLKEMPEKPDKAPKGKEPVHSKLWREFDPKRPLTACQAHFDEIDENGARAGLSFNESHDTYKLFNAAGKIPADKLKQLLATLKTDLHKMAKGSGVEKVGEPSDKVEDRPISVLRAMYAQRLIMPGSVRGFYLTYRHGKVVGAIDVIAVLNSHALDRWELCCAVHEVVGE